MVAAENQSRIIQATPVDLEPGMPMFHDRLLSFDVFRGATIASMLLRPSDFENRKQHAKPLTDYYPGPQAKDEQRRVYWSLATLSKR